MTLPTFLSAIIRVSGLTTIERSRIQCVAFVVMRTIIVVARAADAPTPHLSSAVPSDTILCPHATKPVARRCITHPPPTVV